MLILLIIGIIVFIFGIALINEKNWLAFFLGVVGTWLIVSTLLVVQRDLKPSAIDVYKGKTTLEITYRDGVPVDSVVVFKDKEK